MKLKNKYIGFLPACFLFILVGCEDLKFGNAFLEKPVSTDVTIDTVFSQKNMRNKLWPKCIIHCRIICLQMENCRGAHWKQ